GAALDIWIEPRSWWWPCALLLAGVWGIAVSHRRRSALNGGYFILCVLVTVAVSVELACMARYRVHVDERALDLRFGLFHSLTLERGGLESIETKVAHGRRSRLHYPVLVTTQGRRISLRHVSRHHEVWLYLERVWGMPGMDGQR
ncbi:MAG TPA: hypothetical protein PLA50_14015, partial [Bacteroidia bacterium]|nr:hypothetical protein [Bacteroidia bacterium]